MGPKCATCGKGLEVGPMYRTNPTGEKGIFKHEECGGKAPDAQTKKLCDLIDSDWRERKPSKRQG